MALNKYEGAGQVFWRGRLLAEATRARLSIASNDNEVTTMHKGLAGFSDGPERAQVDIDSAVPKAGYEVDFWDVLRAKEEVVVVVISGGKRRMVEGRVTTFDETKSDTAAATATVTVVGKPIGQVV